MTQIEANDAFKYLESELQAEPFQVNLIMCDVDKHVMRAEHGIRERQDLMFKDDHGVQAGTKEVCHRNCEIINLLS